MSRACAVEGCARKHNSHGCRYADQLARDRERHLERYAYLRRWRQRNPHLLKATLARRKAAKKAAVVLDVSGVDLRRLASRFGGMCAYCRLHPFEHLDHVVPLARGGQHRIGNLLPACAACNLAKGAKLLSEWRYLKPLPRRFRRSAPPLKEITA